MPTRGEDALGAGGQGRSNSPTRTPARKAVHDGRTHLVHALDQPTAEQGVYHALCGHSVLTASLTVPPGSVCAACDRAAVAGPAQREAGR